MKAMILSVATGGGHGRAADAIKESILHNEPGSEVIIIDTIKYISPFLDKLVVGTYLQSLKHYPSFFKYLYEHSDEDGKFVKPAAFGNDFITKQLHPTVKEFDPDIIISTHPFTAQMLSILRAKFGWQKASLVVMTDYGSHAFWVHHHVDAYVVSNEDMVDELIQRGRNKEMIFPYGIPISSNFENFEPNEKTFEKYKLDPSTKVVTVMGGSLGLGNIIEIVQELINLPLNLQVLVLTGSNEKLFNEITEMAQLSHQKISPLEYCDDIYNILSITDLLITKPGGLTMTESFITGTPLAIYSAIPGQEVQNADYLLRHNLAIDLNTGEHCGLLLESILSDDQALEKMKLNSKAHAKPEAADKIYGLCKRLIYERNGEYLGELVEF
ncbi:MAG: UDP-N-acetylglucosamine--LPS N-acetylglucosamine transferase [Clostridium sp.]|nr:UDP-N-acetylglucosamine--LPS N-acetylglucosamine transferase [Clostridium sp.]